MNALGPHTASCPPSYGGPVHWAASHSTPQCWVERFSRCYARVRSRPVHDQPCVARPGPCGPARPGQRARAAEVRSSMHWAASHSTPQRWVNRCSLCYARVRSRPVHDQVCLARPGPCGPTRHGQRARDAPSVSNGSAILCLQRGKGRFGGVSLLSFATRVRTHLICAQPGRHERTAHERRALDIGHCAVSDATVLDTWRA